MYDTIKILKTLRRALDRFNEAKNSKKPKYTVSIIARRYSKGHGSNYLKGFRLHSKIYGDIWKILEIPFYATPFPLAWFFSKKGYWIYGVADLVIFQNGLPIEVWEIKSYNTFKKYEAIQVSLYSYLTYLNFKEFSPNIKAFLVSPNKKVKVDWKENIKQLF